MNTFDFTVITIHTKPTLNPKAEINQLHNILSTYTTSVIPCYSGNAIIMGDFNQGKRFVGSSFQSSLDQLSQYRQLLYSGGSTRARSPPQKHDRYGFSMIARTHLWQSQVETLHYSTVSGLIRLVIIISRIITPDFLCPFMND